MAWQPIESAPLDGTEVLLWTGTCGNVQRAAWDAEAWNGGGWHLGTCLCFGDESTHVEGPTHWMPLPDAP